MSTGGDGSPGHVGKFNRGFESWRDEKVGGKRFELDEHGPYETLQGGRHSGYVGPTCLQTCRGGQIGSPQ